MSTQGKKRPGQVCRASREQGSALVISLLILLLMTLIGVSAVQTSSMQERMAGHSRDHQVAFHAAEAALRAAENLLESTPDLHFNNSHGLWLAAAEDQDKHWNTVNWASSSVDIRETPLTGAGFNNLSRNPAFIIEQLPPEPAQTENLAADEPLPASRMVLITASGWGGSDTTRVRLQSVYRLP